MQFDSPILKEIFVSDIKPQESIRTSVLVRSKELLVSRKGDAYLSLILSDKSGQVEGRVWSGAQEMSSLFREGDVIAICAKAHVFQNRMQLNVDQLAPIPAEEVNLSDYLPRADADLEQMYQALLDELHSIPNEWVRAAALALAQDPEIAARYKVCPAAKTIHHAYIGGLLSHSLNLVRLAKAVHPFYPITDLSYLVFGAAFHDFGKIYELNYDSDFGYSDEGKLVGHITIGVTLLDRKLQTIPDFPKEVEWQLKHLILSHHGKLEFGSPKRPATLEAEIVQALDCLDSRMDSIQNLMKNTNSGDWTPMHRAYEQSYRLPTGGKIG